MSAAPVLRSTSTRDGGAQTEAQWQVGVRGRRSPPLRHSVGKRFRRHRGQLLAAAGLVGGQAHFSEGRWQLVERCDLTPSTVLLARSPFASLSSTHQQFSAAPLGPHLDLGRVLDQVAVFGLAGRSADCGTRHQASHASAGALADAQSAMAPLLPPLGAVRGMGGLAILPAMLAGRRTNQSSGNT